jgi:ribosomal protein S28E/S33
MRLIYRSSGKPVAIGDHVLLRDGEVEVTALKSTTSRAPQGP